MQAPSYYVPAWLTLYQPYHCIVMRGFGALSGLVPFLLLALLAYTSLAQQNFHEHRKILKSFKAQPANLKARNAQGGYAVPTDDYGLPPPYYSEPPPYYPPPEPTESSKESCKCFAFVSSQGIILLTWR